MKSTLDSRSNPEAARRRGLAIALGSLAAIFIAAAAHGNRGAPIPMRAGAAPTSMGIASQGPWAADPSVPTAVDALAHRTFVEGEPAPTF